MIYTILLCFNIILSYMLFNEALLQFVWQHRYFNQQELFLITGEKIDIISPGQRNTNQGPDFLHARIKINDTVWVGNIEIDMLSSNWEKHQHNNKHYANVILHVVYNMDKHNKTSSMPTLELQNKIPNLLLERLQYLMNQPKPLPCSYAITKVSPLIWKSWKDSLLIERLKQKTQNIEKMLFQTKRHWETCLWWLMARNFGQTANADAFEEIATTIPLNIIGKYKNQIHQLESLLLGQAGLLNDNFKEDYPIMLKKEYTYLQHKYKLQQPKVLLHFLRMRPFNFPTIRLAQLAMLLHKSSHLFSIIIETDDINIVRSALQIQANDYWHYHYRFDEITDYKPKRLGKDMIDRLLINVIIPIVFAYGHLQQDAAIIEKAIAWLQHIPAEKNSIVSIWKNVGVDIEHAIDSQALLTLYSQYCENKRCLECAVGNTILKMEE